MKRAAWCLILVPFALALAACEPEKKAEKNDDDDASGGGGAPTHHTVIVLDDGFDSSHEVFKNKIEAEYTITCDKEQDDTIDPDASFEEQKQAVIADYASSKSPCSITEDIQFKADAGFAKILADRASWNEQVQAKAITFEDAKVEEIRKVIGGSAANVNYHGTNTASLIAYQNPDVKLVLIQFDLRNPNDGAVDSKDDCPKQDEIDAWVKLHQDPDVLKAYMDAPLSDADAKLLEIQVKHKTTLVNLSLGTPPRLKLQEQLEESGCGKLDFAEYYEIDGKITRDREAARYAAGVYKGTEPTLIVQAAGNEGVKIDGDIDTTDCGDPANGTVMIGAVDYAGERTSFSNYGKCVQYYMMGQGVVVAAPEQFLDVADGTSFSAPLTVRLLSQKTRPEMTYEEKAAELAKLAGSGQVLSNGTFPDELAFDASAKIPVYALTGRSPRQVYSARRYFQLTHPGALK